MFTQSLCPRVCLAYCHVQATKRRKLQMLCRSWRWLEGCWSEVGTERGTGPLPTNPLTTLAKPALSSGNEAQEAQPPGSSWSTLFLSVHLLPISYSSTSTRVSSPSPTQTYDYAETRFTHLERACRANRLLRKAISGNHVSSSAECV